MSANFDPVFASAVDAAAAIREGRVSSLELTELSFRRIDEFQPKLNAYVYLMREAALKRARQADEALAQKKPLGPLHGVPVHVKESFGVQGMPCTWGAPMLKGIPAAQNSIPVRRLLDAGAILLGATNVPLNLMDCQSFNDIYGTSNNPWDPARTPGGSSGGSAAALAAGLGYLSVGSDIGGSIRGPAAFCGIYGHKPTIDIVNMSGHQPGGMYQNPGFSTLLAAGGPMARSADDLEAGLQMLGGTEPPDSKLSGGLCRARVTEPCETIESVLFLKTPQFQYRWRPRRSLKMVRACERAGAKVIEGWPADFSFPELLETYLFMVGAFSFSVSPPDYQQQARAQLEKEAGPLAKGALSSFAEWQKRNVKRLGQRARWENFFESFDVFLSPVMFTTAFAHDHRPMDSRTVCTPEGREQSYMDLVSYIAPASLTGCPATAAPAGLAKSGLPVGLQVMGPYLEDATPIAFARLLAREIGGFQAPPGYR